MRILFYQHQYPAFGGIETVTTLLARQFVADGHAVRIVSFLHKEGADLLKGLPEGTWHAMPSESPEAIENFAALRKELDDFNPQVLIFQDSYADIERIFFDVVNEWHMGREAKVVVCEHSSPYYWWKGAPKWPWSVAGICKRVLYPIWWGRRYLAQRRRRRYLLANTDRYLVLSKYYIPHVKFLVGNYMLSKVSSMPNPITACDAERADSMLARKEKIILFVGSLIGLKRVDRLIAIWARLEQRHPDWRFEIVGDGIGRSKLEAQVTMLGLQHVSFAGFQRDPTSFYKRASIFVMVSSFEGWPMVLGEAMSYGCVPVVYDSFAAVFEMIQHNVSGILVRHFDDSAFVRALDHLMTDESSLRTLSRNAKNAAEAFTLDVISRRWQNLLRI